MSVSKRGILRGAVGLVAASTAKAASNAQMPGPPMEPYPYRGMFAGRGRRLEAADTIADPVNLAREAAIKLAREQLSKGQEALRRKKRSLERLKSVSPAWIDAQCERIDREEHSLWKAFQEVVGDADDELPF